MDLAAERIKCRNQNKSACIENGCEIIEYNLGKNTDIAYFDSKKYQTIVADLFKYVQQMPEAVYYLLLVGTSARLP